MEKIVMEDATTVWLQQGLWLKDIIMRLVDPGLVDSYIESRDACRRLPWRLRGTAASMAEDQRRRTRRDGLYLACVTPLVHALNRGQIIAVRPDVSNSQFLRLLPPATGWNFQIFDLEKSLIFHPQRSYSSLFVLFLFASRQPDMNLEPVKKVGLIKTTGQERQSSHFSSKTWLESAVQNMRPDDRKHGWKRRYAQKLAGIMAEEAKTNTDLNPMQSNSIVARLNEFKLWPS